MLLTSRADVGLPGVASIRPPGLDEQEGLELIGRLGVQLDSPLAERLLQKTDGSPMLLRLALGQLRNQRIEPVLFIDQLERQPQIAAYLIETMLRGLPNDVWCLISLVAVFRASLSICTTTGCSI
jgi:ATP/maltotriose-dependent transcriptional regulator MalT